MRQPRTLLNLHAPVVVRVNGLHTIPSPNRVHHRRENNRHARSDALLALLSPHLVHDREICARRPRQRDNGAAVGKERLDPAPPEVALKKCVSILVDRESRLGGVGEHVAGRPGLVPVLDFKVVRAEADPEFLAHGSSPTSCPIA